MGSGVEAPGAAHLVLADGVVHLDPEQAVFQAMLAGWERQQRTRFLNDAGRADRQVNIHGVRVELDEIEHHLRSCPGVVWSAATVKPTKDGPSVRATVVVQPGLAVTGLAVRKHIAALLPAVEVPSAVTVLDQIPVGPNGKATYEHG